MEWQCTSQDDTRSRSLDPPKLNVEEGTIEFWFRPDWDVVPRYVGPRGSLEHTLLNIGPVRPDHFYLSNHSSLNTGYRPADALIDELRISSVRRYDEAFVPAKRLDADSSTVTLFHFDGNLDAEIPAGCRAVVGPVQ